MKEQINQRLVDLRGEFESGQKALAELEGREANIRTILQRISGAIQVLEEELAKAGQTERTDELTTLAADTELNRSDVHGDEKADKRIRVV